MISFTKLPAFLVILAIVISSASCGSKENTVSPVSGIKKLLTAQTWQINEVTDVQNGVSTPLYKRGASDNEEDFSAVRQLFKVDGSIIYTGQFGETGSNGKYELLDNDSRLRLSMPDWGFSVTVAALKVTSGLFSYQLGNSEGYTEFIFAPAQ